MNPVVESFEAWGGGQGYDPFPFLGDDPLDSDYMTTVIKGDLHFAHGAGAKEIVELQRETADLTAQVESGLTEEEFYEQLIVTDPVKRGGGTVSSFRQSLKEVLATITA